MSATTLPSEIVMDVKLFVTLSFLFQGAVLDEVSP